MRSVKKFIIPVDFSRASLAAIKYAAFLGKDIGNWGSECVLLHVASEDASDVEINSLEDQLDRLITEYLSPNQITSTAIVVKGDLYEQLPLIQKETNCELVIMGTDIEHRDHSQTATLIRKMDGTVLVVPSSVEIPEVQKIALAIDNERIDDTNRLIILNDLAGWFRSQIHLVLVGHDKQPITSPENSSVLEYYLETIDYSHHLVLNSDIEEGLFDYMKDHDINMVAIMPRTHAKNMEPSDGKLTEALVLHCDKPVLVLD